jgi:hypothetical protein
MTTLVVGIIPLDHRADIFFEITLKLKRKPNDKGLLKKKKSSSMTNSSIQFDIGNPTF